MKGALYMQTQSLQPPIHKKVKPPIIRSYRIGSVKYTVSATTKDGATESAAAKVRRMIRNEIKGINHSHKNNFVES